MFVSPLLLLLTSSPGCLSLQDLAQRTQMPEKGKGFNSFQCSSVCLTHQASLIVPPTPGGNSQSVFEVLGHIVVRHDVVQHSADNHCARGCQDSKRFVSKLSLCAEHVIQGYRLPSYLTGSSSCPV